jgi:hypothetical protein
MDGQMSLLDTMACSKGHDLDETLIYRRPDGTNRCRICERDRDRARNRNKMAKRATRPTPSPTGTAGTATLPADTLPRAPEGEGADTVQRWPINEWRERFPEAWARIAAAAGIVQDSE